MSDSQFTPNANQQQFVDWLRQQRDANVTASPERFAQFKVEFLNQLDSLKLTVPNQSAHATTLFYSGMVDNRQAWEVAEKLGEASDGKIITIGRTELGQLANSKEFFGDVLNDVIDPKDFPTQSADINKAIWDRASHRLASEAKGAVHTITPNAKGDKVYASVELPELMRNDKVTQIDGIDRAELAAMRDRLQTQHGYTPERAVDVVRSRITVQSAIDLEHTHGIRSVMHPELKQATETLRAAAVDMPGSAQGKALTQAVRQVKDLHLHPHTAPAADLARPSPTPMDPDKMARIRVAVKAAGIAGTVYGAHDAKDQIDAAIDSARSNREQWVRGSEETVNQGTKAVVTGAAATVGAIPGAAAGTLTSPVTGPVGPVVGGLATGGAAAYGAEKLYEDSRLQRWSKALGREVGELGYDHVSKEGRLLGQVNSLKQDLQSETDPAKRAQLQTRLNETSETFSTEAERNGRTFEARAGIDQAWEQTHAKYPKVDKDDVNDALAKHIDAGKRPADAARGAISDAVHEKYPRALPHQPVENYRALSNEQLATKHGQYVGEVAQGRQDVLALAANKDSHNNLDQGWPKALAQERQAGRVKDELNELWRDTGHLGAIRESMQERGMKQPELPAEWRPKGPTQQSPATNPRDAFRQQENLDRSREPAIPGRSTGAVPRAELSPQQERHHQLAHTQLGPGLSARGHGAEHIARVSAAAVGHAQQHAHRGDVRAFHLSKDGERVAVVQESAPISEFSVKAAQRQSADQHLERAHAVAQTQAREQTDERSPGREPSLPAAQHTGAGAPQHEAPQRAMA